MKYIHMNIILYVKGKSHAILHHTQEELLICYTSTLYKLKHNMKSVVVMIYV